MLLRLSLVFVALAVSCCAEEGEKWMTRGMLEAVAGAGGSTVILTNTNCGHADMAANLAVSLGRFSISNFLFIAEDQQAFDYLRSRVGAQHVVMPPHAARAKVPQSKGSKSHKYDSEGFRHITFIRPHYLLAVVELGFTAIWCACVATWRAAISSACTVHTPPLFHVHT